jgi:alkylated DNA nucleotide flippase Atl1
MEEAADENSSGEWEGSMLRRLRWRLKESTRGERTPWRRKVNRPEMVEGKMSTEQTKAMEERKVSCEEVGEFDLDLGGRDEGGRGLPFFY